jgi:hypothetical protein
MQLTTEIEKSLALMQEVDGLEWFSTGTGDDVRIWEGDESEHYEKWQAYLSSLEDGDPDNELSFDTWLEQDDNGTEVDVEEYDEYGDWKVYTDDEADDAWDESLDQYVEECILPDLPVNMRYYFDTEKWKDDARIDGRGHSLSGYDGCEEEQVVNGTTYYLYRQN